MKRLVFLLALAAGGPVWAQSPAAPGAPPVRVTTRVEPREVTIGTPFRYTMRVEAAGDVELVVPILAERLGDFFITDFGEMPRQQDEGNVVLERWYTLVTYEPGDQIVPGPPVQYRVPGSELQRLDAPDALVIVDSMLAKAEKADDIHDIRGPAAVPRDYSILGWIAVAVLVLVASVLALFRLLNRSRVAAAPPPRPAHEVALEALTRLRAARLPDAGRHEEYYVRLSSIVRSYLEGRFHLRAPEMTTEEFLQVAQRNPQLAPPQRASLVQFLGEADLVKFARYVPTLPDAERAYSAARQFVESTQPQLEVSRAAA